MSVPVDALSRTDSTVVCHDPGRLGDTITPTRTQDGGGGEVGTGLGKARRPGVSRCHRALVKEMEVEQMKWPTEWKLLVCAKLAPNKQAGRCFFFGGDKHKQGDSGNDANNNLRRFNG